MEIFIPILSLSGIGFIFGVCLALASKKLSVPQDPRLETLLSKLPGANCGVCGKTGCLGFAESLISGEVNIEVCRVSEERIKEEIALILGKKLEKEVKRVAVLHCNGGIKVEDRFLYQGMQDCIAADLVLGGQKACVYGCLGFATCAEVCPFGAIRMSDEGLPIVDANKCRACNKCVEVCPKKLFSLVPIMLKVDAVRNTKALGVENKVSERVYVACSSHDLGKNTRLVCPVGCIACKKCEQACPVSAILVINNLAVIDYKKCTSCGECVKACPTKCIKITYWTLKV